MGVIGIRFSLLLDPVLMACFRSMAIGSIRVNVLVFVAAAALFVPQISQAEASHVLALAVALAGASAAETILSWFHALAQDHAVYEAEVGRDDGLVLGIDDGDGGVLVDGKGAELAEVARIFFGSVFLSCWLECVLVISCDE